MIPGVCHFTPEQDHLKVSFAAVRAVASKSICIRHCDRCGQIALRRTVPVSTSTSRVRECVFSCRLECYQTLDFCQSDRWEMLSVWTFNLLFFFITKKGEHPLIYLWAVCISFSENCVFISLIYFSTDVFKWKMQGKNRMHIIFTFVN